MKKRALTAALLILTALLIAACAQDNLSEESNYQLYYTTQTETASLKV